MNAEASGFVLAKRPLGFGYQSQTCSVMSGPCQKLNLAPLCGLVCAHADSVFSGVNVPST